MSTFILYILGVLFAGKTVFKNLFLVMNLAVFTCIASNAQIILNTDLQEDTILIGDQISLILESKHPLQTKVQFPLLQDTLTNTIAIINVSAIDTLVSDDEMMVQKQHYTITSFDSGVHIIPPFRFIIAAQGQIDTIYSRPLELTVNTLPVNLDKEIKDIKDIYNYPITLQEILMIVLLLFTLGLICVGVMYIIKKIKRKEPLFHLPEKPKIPPEVVAKRELDKLKSQKLWQQGRVKDYYSRLTEIIRTYIEDRYHILAMEQTTYEILYQFSPMGYDHSKEYEMLAELLMLADLVKFAKGQALPDENEKHLANAYIFVELTTPKEVEEESSNALPDHNEQKGEPNTI